jgi:hypothetical protein
VIASSKLSFPRAEKLVTNSSLEPRIVETRLLELNSQCHLMTMPIDSPRARICRQRVDPICSRCIVGDDPYSQYKLKIFLCQSFFCASLRSTSEGLRKKIVLSSLREYGPPRPQSRGCAESCDAFGVTQQSVDRATGTRGNSGVVRCAISDSFLQQFSWIPPSDKGLTREAR